MIAWIVSAVCIHPLVVCAVLTMLDTFRMDGQLNVIVVPFTFRKMFIVDRRSERSWSVRMLLCCSRALKCSGQRPHRKRSATLLRPVRTKFYWIFQLNIFSNEWNWVPLCACVCECETGICLQFESTKWYFGLWLCLGTGMCAAHFYWFSMLNFDFTPRHDQYRGNFYDITSVTGWFSLSLSLSSLGSALSCNLCIELHFHVFNGINISRCKVLQ